MGWIGVGSSGQEKRSKRGEKTKVEGPAVRRS